MAPAVLFALVGNSIEKTPVLVTMGVPDAGQRKESASSWREFFKDLKRGDLDSAQLTLRIMDCLPGLENVFAGEFSKARAQRCQIHVAGNVLVEAPRKFTQVVADGMRSILYASSKEIVRQFFAEFKAKGETQFPSAAKCLEKSLDACPTLCNFPEEEWISLRTTNIIDRLNKEFRRKTKPVKIVIGERSCHAFLAFISTKMECYWEANPIGKERKNLLLRRGLEQ